MSCRAISTMLFIIVHGHAFSLDVHGTIMANDEPLPGVLVYVANHNDNFFVSDSLGCFYISDVQESDSIVFSFIGLREQRISVYELLQNNKVVMTEESTHLNEVLVFRSKEFSSDFPMKSYSQLEIYSSPSSQADPLNAVLSSAASTNTNESAKPSLRGSSMGYTMVYINEVPVFYPTKGNLVNNSIASTSSMNTSFVSSESIYASNSPIEFENSASGSVDMRLNTEISDKRTLFLSTVGSSFSITKNFNNSFIESYLSYTDLYPFLKMNNLDKINHYRSCDAGVHIYKRLKNSKYSLYSSYICEDGNYPMPYYDNNANYLNKNTYLNSIVNYEYYHEGVKLKADLSYSHLKSDINYNSVMMNEHCNYLYGAVSYSQFMNDHIQYLLGINSIFSNYNANSDYYNNWSDATNGAMGQITPYFSIKLISGDYSALLGAKYCFAKESKPSLNANLSLKYANTIHKVLITAASLHMYNYYESALLRYSKMSCRQVCFEYDYNKSWLRGHFAVYLKDEKGINRMAPMIGEYKKNIFGIEASFDVQLLKNLSWTISNYYLDTRYSFLESTYRGEDKVNYFIKSTLSYENPKTLNVALSVWDRPGTYYTPVEDAIYISEYDYYIPVYSQHINSSQFNRYFNVCVNVSKTVGFSFGKAMFFLGITNLFNSDNNSAIYYNEDYSKSYIMNYMGRSLFLGFIIHFK